ncbi:GTP 3',8-cyclase [subsurface metagenome]
MKEVFGPVPSRRLGFSLGVDLVPFKTCTLGCVYCQLGRTTHKTLQRQEYIPMEGILPEVEKILNKGKRIDYITFSGSGEPTLHSGIGKMISRIKRISSIPVAVLTNGTLLDQGQVQEDLWAADLVIPSLDAVDERIFQRINRPHASLNTKMIIRGLDDFAGKFPGKIWLEVMLMRGLNDSKEHIQKIANIIGRLPVEKVQLNTPHRPPAEDFARTVSSLDLRRQGRIFGGNCEIIPDLAPAREKILPNEEAKNMAEAILSLIRKRPVSLDDISLALGRSRNEILKYLEFWSTRGKIKSRVYQRKRYYQKRD